MRETTLICLKPDAAQRGITGEVIAMFERKGLKVCALKMIWLTEDQLYQLYKSLKEKPFHDLIHKFMLSGPCVAAVLSGHNAVKAARTLAGATRSPEEDISSVRGRFAVWTGCDVIHSACSREEADEQIAMFFSENEIYEYKRLDEHFMSQESWDEKFNSTH